MTEMIEVTPAVVEGLKHVVVLAERELSSVVMRTDTVIKSYYSSPLNPGGGKWVWYSGTKLAMEVERHGKRILAAVATYRAAVREYEDACNALAVKQDGAA